MTVFVVALLARLTVILRDGGLHGWYGYDSAVYFAGSDALVHGRLPYSDFVLLHPPGLLLALTPFAALTHTMSDDAAFTTAVVASAVLGAANAALVTGVALRLGVGRPAAVAGGMFYALWFGTIGAEYLVKLEPLGNLCLLVALRCALRAHRGPRALLFSGLGGAALGVAVSVQIWWIVPLLAVVAWHADRTRERRATFAMLAGIVVAVAVVDLPVFVNDPSGMWRSVVVDQVSRSANGASVVHRLVDLSTLPRLVGPVSGAGAVVAAAVVVLLLGLLTTRAWSTRAGRPAAVLLLGQLAVLLAAPSWFPYYGDYLGVAAALTVAAAAQPVAARRGANRTGAKRIGADRARAWRPASRLAPAAAALVTVPALLLGTSAVRPFRGAAVLTRAVADRRCVMSDSPMALVELDALSRGLAAGCPNWIDVTGRTYGPDRAAVPRRDNARWQRDLTGYLRAGDAVVIARPVGSGVDARTRRAVRRDGVLARAGGHVVYRVRH